MAIVKLVEAQYRFQTDIERLIRYVLNPEETKSSAGYPNYLVGAAPCLADMDAPGRVQRTVLYYSNNHSMWNVESGKLVHHIVVSFADEELQDPCLAWAIGMQISQWYFTQGFICCYGVHTSTDNLHVHIVVDNISYMNGSRFFIQNEIIGLKAQVNAWLATCNTGNQPSILC